MSVTSHLILIYMWTQLILGGTDIYSMIFMDVRFQIVIHFYPTPHALEFRPAANNF